MNKKKIIIIVGVLLVVGAGYKLFLAKPSEPEAKVHGQVYVLPKEFTLNLADGRYAKLGVGLVLSPDDQSMAAGGHGGEAAKPPEGYGPMPQEGLIRDIVTDTLTDGTSDSLVDKEGREDLKKSVLRQIKKRTDVHAEDVLFTDISVQ